MQEMSPSTLPDAIGTADRALGAALDGAMESADLRLMADGDLLALAGRAQQLAARVEAAHLLLVAEVERRDAAQHELGISTGAWLRETHGYGSREAHGLVRRAGRVIEQEHVWDGMADGVVLPRQADAICDALALLPEDLAADKQVEAQKVMVTYASEFDPKELRQLAHRLVEVVDPDHADELLAAQLERQEARAWQTRELHFWPDGHGSMNLRGKLPLAEGEQLAALIDAIADRARRRARGLPTVDRPTHTSKEERNARSLSDAGVEATPDRSPSEHFDPAPERPRSAQAPRDEQPAGFAAESERSPSERQRDEERTPRSLSDEGVEATRDHTADCAHHHNEGDGATGPVRGRLPRKDTDAASTTGLPDLTDTSLDDLTDPVCGPACPGPDCGLCGGRPSRAMARADALMELAHAFADADHAPALGADRPRLNLTVTLDQLTTGLGTVDVAGQRLSAQELRRLACDSEIIPMVLNSLGVPLDVGAAKRFFTPGQRAALIARDGGCIFPGCDRPPRQCECHHIIPWHLRPWTAITNGVLLCCHHHALCEPSRKGPDPHRWEVRINPTDGLPEFLPPITLDAHRRPRRHIRHRIRQHRGDQDGDPPG
ncbi:HNH endonuclease signature motif containing protein [Mariniluteicoccus flavus]